MSGIKTKQSKETIQKLSQFGDPQRRAQQAQRKKPILLQQLENELKHLDDMDEEEDFQNCEDPSLNDSTLERLKLIAREAKKLEILEIEKLSRLAIGKRILNLELKKKTDEHKTKLKKKEKIQLFFRQNRIKRFDYDSLADRKLAHSTLIVRAYPNGKGFHQSDRYYHATHSKALAECDFTATVKEVNRIFYKNYSGDSKATTFSDTLMKTVWLPVVVLIGLGLTLPFFAFPYQDMAFLGMLGVVVGMLGVAAFLAFLDRPSDNNQIEQSIEDVRSYFKRINQRSALQGKNIEWVCPKELMYLEVVFHAGFPT